MLNIYQEMKRERHQGINSNPRLAFWERHWRGDERLIYSRREKGRENTMITDSLYPDTFHMPDANTFNQKVIMRKTRWYVLPRLYTYGHQWAIYFFLILYVHIDSITALVSLFSPIVNLRQPPALNTVLATPERFHHHLNRSLKYSSPLHSSHTHLFCTRICCV